MTADAPTLFRPDAGAYIRRLTRRGLLRYVWIPLIVTGICTVLAFQDLRFAYLGLIFALIVYPMALSLVWMAYGARRSTALLTRPQRWHRTPDSRKVVVEFYPFAALEVPEKAEDENDATAEEPVWEPVAKLTFTLDEVTDIDTGSAGVAFWLGKGRADGVRLLTAPADAVPPDVTDELNKMLTFKV